MSDNPFQAPQQDKPHGFQPGQQSLGRGYVQQVPVIAALMIVQGVLLLLFALAMFGYAFFFSQMDTFLPPEQQVEFQEQFDQQSTIMVFTFGALSVATFPLAVMHFMAAYFGFTYKYRVFGITTLMMGLAASLTCYCAPTAIGLGVYGMIIYFNPAVARAFALAKSGMSKQAILDQFPS